MYLTLKQVLAVLLCAAMLAGNAFALDSEALREKHGDSLEAKGIFLYGIHEFQEGLMPVLVNNSWNYQLDVDWVPETIWNYIDENLKIVDLNKGRFTYVYPFFEGLAAVIGDGGVGYIDKTGKIVIPCGFFTYDIMGTVYTGYFKDGTAPVLKEFVTTGPSSGMTPTYQVGRIDRTGNLVQPYKEMSTLNGQNFVSDGGNMLDAVPIPEPTKPDLSIRFDDDYYMSDIGPINDLTITNNTTEPITGVYTLLLYYPKMYCLDCSSGLKQLSHTDNPSADIYPFDLNLAPGESIIKTAYFGSERNLTGTKFVWVEYDDAAERDTYLNDSALFRTNTVDYAASYDNYVGYWVIQDAAYLARYPYDITLEPVKHNSK